jgi:hypothetical protein
MIDLVVALRVNLVRLDRNHDDTIFGYARETRRAAGFLLAAMLAAGQAA